MNGKPAGAGGAGGWGRAHARVWASPTAGNTAAAIRTRHSFPIDSCPKRHGATLHATDKSVVLVPELLGVVHASSIRYNTEVFFLLEGNEGFFLGSWEPTEPHCKSPPYLTHLHQKRKTDKASSKRNIMALKTMNRWNRPKHGIRSIADQKKYISRATGRIAGIFLFHIMSVSWSLPTRRLTRAHIVDT
jgi:hypothetical protein